MRLYRCVVYNDSVQSGPRKSCCQWSELVKCTLAFPLQPTAYNEVRACGSCSFADSGRRHARNKQYLICHIVQNPSATPTICIMISENTVEHRDIACHRLRKRNGRVPACNHRGMVQFSLVYNIISQYSIMEHSILYSTIR